MEAPNFSVHRSTRIADSSNKTKAPVANSNNNTEPISSPSNAPSSSHLPKPDITLFNSLKTYNEDEAQILDTLRCEAEITGSDLKSGEQVVQWLS